ncbi:ribokinase [Purpureocillium lavendulum]|uniref:Ribokinase n=1 Tax=Purpureocillium lavendulum TaxID=1247861 RepID=A0AB34G1F5_9HYPO|nr:ribokinase [Purpureocillium lavendulum]
MTTATTSNHAGAGAGEDAGAARLPRITILGSLNMDLVSYVPHHPLPGETLTSSHFTTSPGGKGANQAVACGKLSRTSSLTHPSAVVAMLGAVGSDAYGPVLTRSLASYGVDVSGVVVRGGSHDNGVNGAKTGIAIIVVDEPSGQNRIILSPEANHSLRPADFASLPGPLPDLLIMQLEIPLDTVLQALAAARDASVPVLLNPAPAQPLPEPAYRGLAHLVVNETEAAILSGCSESELDDLPGMERIGAIFIARGVRNVIITLGGRGVYYVTESGKSALVQAKKANVVDTTAAGDTFVGSYALAAVKPDFDIDRAVREANRAAAITVSRKGAQVSIPWKDELE